MYNYNQMGNTHRANLLKIDEYNRRSSLDSKESVIKTSSFCKSTQSKSSRHKAVNIKRHFRFKYERQANEVFLMGKFENNSISKFRMVHDESQKSFYFDIELRINNYFYYFLADGERTVNSSQPITINSSGSYYNILESKMLSRSIIDVGNINLTTAPKNPFGEYCRLSNTQSHPVQLSDHLILQHSSITESKDFDGNTQKLGLSYRMRLKKTTIIYYS